VSRLATTIFGLLVLATGGAFFVTQKLKSSPPLIIGPRVTSVFSPTPGAARTRARARITFYLKRADDFTLSVVAADGTIVRTLVDGRHLQSYKRILVLWNGRTNSGRLAPDGRYRVRVALIGQGRTLDLSQTTRLDTHPALVPRRKRAHARKPAHR
jgi:hypothetical protein